MGKTKHSPAKNLLEARVIASHGRHYLAKDEAQQLWQVFGKGKKREVAVGDQLLIEPSGDNQAWVHEIKPRKNLLYRSDAVRSKLFAANLDQTLLVLSCSPPYSSELLGRTWLACKLANVPLSIVFNKIDLIESPQDLEEILSEIKQWTHNEVTVYPMSIKTDQKNSIAQLASLLNKKTTLILGQSGMGKSTLLNLMIPDALAATNEVSMALNAGKHTTTHTRLYEGPEGMDLIDSPGFQAFGLNHLEVDALKEAFEDISQQAMRCRFANCQHKQEPQCMVKEAIEQGTLFEPRLELMHLILEEIQTTHY